MKKFIIILLLSICANNIQGGTALPPQIDSTLFKIHSIGQQYGTTELLQAISLQETNGGTSDLVGSRHLSPINRSYGIMQVQIGTARSILSRDLALKETLFPGQSTKNISNQQLITLLMENDEANITIAAKVLQLYTTLCKGNIDKAVAAYNMGIGAVESLKHPSSFKYVVEVKNKLRTIVRPFNLLNDLPTVDNQSK
jgi:Transglycosylase SLT domain